MGKTVKIMKTSKRAYEQELTNIAAKIRKAAIYECIDVIDEKANQLFKLLQNGQQIFESATGRQFENMYNKRRHLWNKHIELMKISNKLYDLASEK